MLSDVGQRNAYTLLRGSQESVAQMTRYGMAFDWEKLKDFPKIHSMYARYRAEDGRVHPDINLCGSKTWRITSSGPCLHSIPNEVKGLVVPQAGYVFVDADFKQSELRLAAELSKDDSLRTCLAEGRDCHAETAARLFGKDISEVTSKERSFGKAANFGFLYGQDGVGLHKKLVKDGIFKEDSSDNDLKLCCIAKTQFDERYPALTKWIERQKGRCFSSFSNYPASGVRTALGRRIPLLPLEWQWENKVANYIIQGTGAELMLAVLCKLPDLLRGTGGRILLSVYDEILLEVPEENAVAAVTATETAISRAFTMMFPGADTRRLADINTGRNWAEAKGK